MCIRLFCTFLSHHCKTATGNFLISRAYFLEYTTQKFSFSFSNLDTVLSDSNPETFANILTNEMNLNKINEVETVQTHFYKWCVWFVVIWKFCYHGNGTFMFYSVGFYIVYKTWSIWEFYINYNLFASLLGVKGLTKEPSSLECRVSFYLGGRNMKARLTPPPPYPKKKKSSASLRSSYKFSHFFLDLFSSQYII